MLNLENLINSLPLNESIPNLTMTFSLVSLLFIHGFWKAHLHPVALKNVNYEDPITLYAFLNQTCGTISVPINETSTVNKLVQYFPGIDIRDFIDRYENLIPNGGAGLVEAQQQLANSPGLWMIGRGLTIPPKQTFMEYFIQDAQVSGLIQECNGYYNLGSYNLAFDMALFGATVVGIPLLCYCASDIFLGLANTADSVILNPLSFESLKWCSSAFFSATLIKSLGALSEQAFIMPCKMYNFLTWGVSNCVQVPPFVAKLYASLANGMIKNNSPYPVIINENIIFTKVTVGNYPAINPLFLMRTECFNSIATGLSSLSMLSNLGWELSFSLGSTITPESGSLPPSLIENVDITNLSTEIKHLKICGR